ncbi:MAG: GTP-binding protein, partial [Akkermansiaceae bacterium]|nr:GTP-binding protein [Akkermansiaceae bacterium]
RLGDGVSEKDGSLISLYSGSISEGRSGDFAAAVTAMKARSTAHLLIETSGGTRPSAIIEQLLAVEGVTLGAVATLVDARMLLHDYSGGPGLIRRLEGDPVFTDLLLAEQIQSASFIVLTKLDMIPADQLTPMFRTLQELNPWATLAACAYGNMDAAILLDAPPYQRRRGITLAPEAADTIGSVVVRDARPLHPRRFYELFQKRLGVGLFRSKGFIWFPSRDHQVLLWNQAGGAMGLEFLGIWRAHVLATDTRLLAEERTLLRERMATTDPLFGDRYCELTPIGLERDRMSFAKHLQACFCTEEEVRKWQAGEVFEDPWPKELANL